MRKTEGCPKREGCELLCEPGGCDYMDSLYDHDDDGCCPACGGEGIIITCCDDMCIGAGHCFHGDGEMLCPTCGGDL
jgi:hypothetical protein